MDRELDGPWLQAAFFCDQAAKNEGEIYSFSGVHDGVVTDGRLGAYTEPVFVLMLTSGLDPQTVALRIVGHGPWPDPIEVIVPQILRFDGPRSGHTMVSPIRIPAEQHGTVWFDVLLDGRLITRMPFNVVVERGE